MMTGCDVPSATLLELLTRQAAQRPDASAILAPGRVPLTYRKLAEHVAATSARLGQLGICRDDRVAILLPNGAEMALAFLSVACAATSAPLNPAYSASELEFYLADLQAKAVVVPAGDGSPAVSIAHARHIPVIELVPSAAGAAGLFELRGEGAAGVGSTRPARCGDIALALHTSGTTARPKLAPLTHGNLCASAASIGRSLQLGVHDRCLNVMPLFHIHGLGAALLASLSAGASVVCAPGFIAPQFLSWLETYRVTWYTAVPTMHQAIVARAEARQAAPLRTNLRFIRSCSAALAPKLMGELERTFGVPVIEAYGMTEAAHQITSNPLPPAVRKPGSVGRAAGPDVAIMAEASDALLPAPGERGEVVIRGPSVMHGYAGNAQANARAFAAGWFRTGDEGYLDRDGYLFLTGRLKEIINRGGEKISPREVDDVLLDHPAVAQAVTFALPDARLGEDIAAAVVARQASVSEADLRRFASLRLAPFKVPGRILIVDDIPKGPTGKIQRIGMAERLGLLASAPAATAESRPFVAARSDTEKMLAALWCDVLRVARVGMHDHFLDVGGDSVLAAQIVARIDTTWPVNVTLFDFFSAQTIAEQAMLVEELMLAGMLEPQEATMTGQELPVGEIGRRIAQLSPEKRALLEQRLRTRRPATARSIPRRPQSGPSAQSFAQQRLWFVDQVEPGNIAYNSSRIYKLDGAVDAAILEKSFAAIVQRHEALRTTLREAGGQPVQIIAPSIDIPLSIVDLQDLPGSERMSQALERIKQARRLSFSLADGPLIRTSLYVLGAQEYVLHVMMHHVATDGWSMDVLFQELCAHYNAFIAGEPSPLPDLPIQYADFAAWQRAELAGEKLAQLSAYWASRLQGIAPLDLPTDRPRPAVQTYKGSREQMLLAEPLMASLRALSRSAGCTPYMTLLAAFAVLLHRYSGQEDITIACPIANRTRPELEGLIGFFVNMLVMRLDLSADPSFAGLLQRVRQTALDGYVHQDLPFEKLVDELHLDRSLSRSPLFQVTFNYLNTPQHEFLLHGVRTQWLDVEHGTAIFDIAIYLRDTPEGAITCTAEYNSDLYDRSTIVRMLGHYRVLLESIASDANQPVSTMPLLTAAEKQQILVEWNDTQTTYPRQATIASLFEAEVKKHRDATALVCGEDELSYSELNRRANRLAHYLQKRGAGPDVPIGLCMQRAPAMIIGLLGILKAGSAYVPLDPDSPPARLAFMLQDTGIKLLVTERQWLGVLPTGAAQAICLDSDLDAINKESCDDPASAATADSLAYIMYTSGTTGQPRGTAIPQRGVIRLVKATNYVTLTGDDALLQSAPLSFDASTFEIWGSLLNGAKLVQQPERLPSLEELGQSIRRHHITTLWLTAGLFRQMVESQLEALHGVRQLLAGGDVLPVAQVRAALEHPHCYRLINGYGPTENTTFTSCYAMTSPDDVGATVSIGRPIANTQVYILDKQRQPVPIGVPGELYTGGDGLARGYWRRPELTAEKFVANPFAGEPGARLYRTGDLVRYLPDGNIEFLGRIDNQVKIRGFRVEPGEIESTLTQHPAVRETVVVAQGDGTAGKRLVAYVVAAGTPPAGDELRTFLLEKLPDYMIPSAFVTLAALPLTPNGKIDRRALPVPDQAQAAGEAAVPPRDELDRRLLDIWEDVLDVRPIGIRDNFFDLGGHSLLAMRLFAQMAKAFSRRLPVAMLFLAPTVEQFADLMRHAELADARSLLVPIRAAGSRTPFFCVHGFGGGVLGYAGLARLLGDDRPFYGLQARGVDDNVEPQTGIEEMAASYLQAVRSVQPHGPYLLGGYCYGGVVAYEMARQLQAEGESVAHLALFEAAAPNTPREPRTAAWAWAFVRNLPFWLRDFWQQAESDTPLLPRLRARLGAARRLLALRRGAQPAQMAVDQALAGAAAPERLQELMRIHVQAMRAYDPQPYAGPVTLYRVRTLPFFRAGDVTKGWGRLVGDRLEIKPIAGAHYNLLEQPHVADLAAQLRDSLDAAAGGKA